MKMSLVLWADACMVGGVGWTNIDHDRYPVLSAGIIVRETEETLHLSRDYDGGENCPWRAVIAIPKTLIVTRRDFKIPAKFVPILEETK